MRILFIPFLSLVAYLAVIQVNRLTGPSLISDQKFRAVSSIRCSPNLAAVQKWIEDTDIPPMPGAGKYTWNIHALHDSAQFYFNQGINMYYGFHIIEALASFKKAAKFQQGNPMIWWATALAYGPNINDVSYSFLPQAVQAARKAKKLDQQSSPFERALIEAMVVRYSDDSSQSRAILNANYVKVMKAVYQQFPSSADAAALFVDAVMIEHPWELWNVNGTPKPWTPAIREVLEKSLIRNPEHPGLNHYYIHVMEPSPFPEKATACADRLGNLNPGLSHLVHMPSHIYLRTGNYIKGYTVNENALSQYKNYLKRYAPVQGGEFLYRLHSQHMLVNCAMQAGLRKYSLDAALDLQQIIDSSLLSSPGGAGNYAQYIYMIPVLTNIRFSAWDSLLNSHSIEKSYVYANLLWHFGRGMAFCGKNDIANANNELSTVKKLKEDSVLYASYAPFSSAIDGAVIAENMLEGSIFLGKKENEKALKCFSTAVEREKSMVYNEPRDWLLNPKYYLAYAFFISGKLAAAENTFKADLKDNNENVWSLAGLYKTQGKLHKHSEAAQTLQRLKKAASKSDLHFVED